jgi:hypothetical protein
VAKLAEQFLTDRREALLSLDKEKISNYMLKYGTQPPKDEDIFWMSVHKARTALKELPLDARQKSKDWLTERGYRSFDDGDLK